MSVNCCCGLQQQDPQLFPVIRYLSLTTACFLVTKMGYHVRVSFIVRFALTPKHIHLSILSNAPTLILTACFRGDGKVPCRVGQNCPIEHSLECGSSVRVLNLAMRLPKASV